MLEEPPSSGAAAMWAAVDQHSNSGPADECAPLAVVEGCYNLSSVASKPAFDYRDLPIPDRLQLVAEIWDSIAHDATVESLPLSDEEKAMLDERLAELEANPDAGRPWPEVRASIIERYGKRQKP